MKDRTELCEIDSWELCKRSDCRWHGSCHREAMMQPPPADCPSCKYFGLDCSPDPEEYNIPCESMEVANGNY